MTTMKELTSHLRVTLAGVDVTHRVHHVELLPEITAEDILEDLELSADRQLEATLGPGNEGGRHTRPTRRP